MLGAIDQPDQQTATPPTQQTQVTRGQARKPDQDQPEPESKGSDCVVMTVQADITPDLRSNSSDVTPLDSDELFSNGCKSTSGKPLTMEELNKDMFAPHSRHLQRNGQPLNGALQELKSLENQHRGVLPPPQNQPSFYSVREDNKENVQDTAAMHYSKPSGQPPLLQSYHSTHHGQQSNEPFSRLMGILRQVNQDLGAPPGAGPPGPMSFLRLDDGTRGPPPPGLFPPIQAWSGSPQPQSSHTPHGPMPYLPQSQARLQHEPPERDSATSYPQTSSDRRSNRPQTGLEGYNNIPLLRLPEETRFDHLEENRSVSLVPPQAIIDYEQKKYHSQTAARNQLNDYLKKEMHHHNKSAKGLKQPFQPSFKLLKVDMEPFGPADERDKETRQRRRMQKLSESPRRGKRVLLNQSGDQSVRLDQLGTDDDIEEDSLEVRYPIMCFIGIKYINFQNIEVDYHAFVNYCFVCCFNGFILSCYRAHCLILSSEFHLARARPGKTPQGKHLEVLDRPKRDRKNRLPIFTLDMLLLLVCLTSISTTTRHWVQLWITTPESSIRQQLEHNLRKYVTSFRSNHRYAASWYLDFVE